MPEKKYVFPHPINVFLIGDQNIPTEKFCSLYGFNQSRISMWITRERRVEELPASFIYCLSLASGKSMDDVYDRLLNIQEEYDEFYKKNQNKRRKKVVYEK